MNYDEALDPESVRRRDELADQREQLLRRQESLQARLREVREPVVPPAPESVPRRDNLETELHGLEGRLGRLIALKEQGADRYHVSLSSTDPLGLEYEECTRGGVMVTSVAHWGTAYTSGIQPGATVVRVQGHPIRSGRDLSTALSDCRAKGLLYIEVDAIPNRAASTPSLHSTRRVTPPRPREPRRSPSATSAASSVLRELINKMQSVEDNQRMLVSELSEVKRITQATAHNPPSVPSTQQPRRRTSMPTRAYTPSDPGFPDVLGPDPLGRDHLDSDPLGPGPDLDLGRPTEAYLPDPHDMHPVAKLPEPLPTEYYYPEEPLPPEPSLAPCDTGSVPHTLQQHSSNRSGSQRASVPPQRRTSFQLPSDHSSVKAPAQAYDQGHQASDQGYPVMPNSAQASLHVADSSHPVPSHHSSGKAPTQTSEHGHPVLTQGSDQGYPVPQALYAADHSHRGPPSSVQYPPQATMPCSNPAPAPIAAAEPPPAQYVPLTYTTTVPRAIPPQPAHPSSVPSSVRAPVELYSQEYTFQRLQSVSASQSQGGSRYSRDSRAPLSVQASDDFNVDLGSPGTFRSQTSRGGSPVKSPAKRDGAPEKHSKGHGGLHKEAVEPAKVAFPVEQQDPPGVSRVNSLRYGSEPGTPPDTPPRLLRFRVGSRVTCNVGSGRWKNGTVMATNWRGATWKADQQTVPYKIKIDHTAELVYAPVDDDRVVHELVDNSHPPIPHTGPRGPGKPSVGMPRFRAPTRRPQTRVD